MAQTGFTPISNYYSATATNVPTAGNLVAGELAINTADGKIFYKDSSGVVQTIASKSATAGTYSSITTSNLTIGTTQLGAGNASTMKNRIINGAMVIDQRNAGASITPTTGQYSVDRWNFYLTQSSKFTAQQSSTAPAGFTNSLKVTSSSAYSVSASDYFMLDQSIEGYNVADLGWGTATAKTVTLSFWVQSSLTGTFGGCVGTYSAGRSYPFTYTISSANTWEQKSVTIVGDTSGTWPTTNGGSIALYFGLGAGSTYSGTAGSWSGGNYYSATGATSVVGTSGATFYITGCQLEVGSSSTGYEYRQYGTELALCQRYWQKLGGVNQYDILIQGYFTSGANPGITLTLPVAMRTSPTGTKVGTWNVTSAGQPTVVATSTSTITINAAPTTTAAGLINTVDSTTYLSLSAEL